MHSACFDVAGPVAAGAAKLTNLPWKPLRESVPADTLKLRSVRLLNDLEAIALGITRLPPGDLLVLHRRKRAPTGAIAVVAPGTGLGGAFLLWTGGRYTAYPSEGGHGDFAPGTPREVELLGVGLPAVREAADHVQPYLRIDGTKVWSLLQLERQLRPHADGRVHGGYVTSRRPRASGSRAGDRRAGDYSLRLPDRTFTKSKAASRC